MKAYIALGFLASILVPAAHAGAFKDETDRFSGTRGIIWNSIPSAQKDFALSAYVVIPKQGAQFTGYRISLLTWANEWQYLDCHSVDWLIDGRPAPYLQAVYKNSSSGSATIERFDADISKEAMTTLSRAKLIEFKVCNTEGRVSESDLAGLRKVIEVADQP